MIEEDFIQSLLRCPKNDMTRGDSSPIQIRNDKCENNEIDVDDKAFTDTTYPTSPIIEHCPVVDHNKHDS